MARDKKTLNVGVIGAGIAGLGAAIALRRAGHKVEIFEKSRFKNEIGAAISLTPNSNRILAEWGFDFVKAKETDKLQNRRLKPDSLELVADMDLTDAYETFGYRFSAFHRVDLHANLRELATDASLPGSVPDIKLGASVTDIDCESGTLTFSDGSSIQKDLIVIADGVKSSFVHKIIGFDMPAKKTNRSVYRTLIPIEKLLADETVRPLYENQPSGFTNTNYPKGGNLIVTYPCRADEIMNVAVFHKTRDFEQDKNDWQSPATVEDILSELKEGFHPAWIALAKCADTVTCYPVLLRDPIPHMNKGKAVIIGDAAHAMLPTHAQGGSMGLEDAATLEVFFRNISDADSIEKRLELFNQFRLPRAATTQLLSNGMMYHQSAAENEAGIRKYYNGPLLPLDEESWSPKVRDFFFSFKVFEEAEKALSYLDVEGGIPEGAIQLFGRPAS